MEHHLCHQKKTVTLIPMKDTDLNYSEEDFKKYKKHFKILRENLENFDYANFNQFYTHNNIESNEHYTISFELEYAKMKNGTIHSIHSFFII